MKESRRFNMFKRVALLAEVQGLTRRILFPNYLSLVQLVPAPVRETAPRRVRP
jgi:hypothetical protein